MSTIEFAHLHFHSPFSFLDGAARLEEALPMAADKGLRALALTDHDNVSGAVLFQRLALEAGVKPIQGAEVTLEGGRHLTLLARGPEGYATLCCLLTRAHLGPLLTRAHLGSPRRRPVLTWADLEDVVGRGGGVAGGRTGCSGPGLIALSGCRRGEIPSLLLAGRMAEAHRAAARYLDLFGRDGFALEVQREFLPGGSRLEAGLVELTRKLGLRLVATNNVHYVCKEDFWVHDLLTCARTLTTVEDVHPERRLNAENYLKSPAAMTRLFADLPEAVRGAVEIAESCSPALVPGRRLHPAFPLPSGETSSAAFLRKMTLAGATRRYGWVSRRVRERLETELDVICRLGYEDYFLLVWDLCLYARRRGIRFAGRGSAADSAVAYCLGITNVDAVGRGLLFERFMSLERGEKPDIDIDFDARCRDEVVAYVTARYGGETGRAWAGTGGAAAGGPAAGGGAAWAGAGGAAAVGPRVASVCTYNTFHARSAVRDLGKALGLPPADLDRLARHLPYAGGADIPSLLESLPELRDSGLPFWKFERLFAAAAKVAGFPRHLGTHLGGLVVCREPLTTVTPLQWAAKGVVVCQFDKEYVEDLGLIKLDLLSLRTLSAVNQAATELGDGFDYDAIPPADPATMAMIRRGETVGVFQLESPAQRALQARLGVTSYEDLVASVALIRPGPIRGNMVEPFLARRRGFEPVAYLHPALEPILKKTYGVVLFQEQVIEIAVAVAGFSPGEADRLRRVMTHHRRGPEMEDIGRLFVTRAVERGVDEETARRIFAGMEGYASYGFCEAHAAAFADTAYRTAYLARHHPAEFFAALFSQQPMGYYPPGTLCVEAARRGVRVLPPDVNLSGACYLVEKVEGAGGAGSLEGGEARARTKGIRVSLRQVKGMQQRALEAILGEREERGPFSSLRDFCRRCCPPVPRDVVEALILCGAFDSLDPNRRRLLWELPGALSTARGGPGLLEEGADPAGAGPPAEGGVRDFTAGEKMLHEYDILGFSPESHLLAYLRPRLERSGFLSSADLGRAPAGRRVRVAGLTVRPHRPPTRSGRTVVFLSLEDEKGLIDVTVFDRVYQRYGRLLFADPSPPLAVEGTVERRGRAVTVVARRIETLAAALDPP
ncbi:MAG: DNA polymerase III subunit alpha [Bacillota bacterium]